jgi:hypothetical protein
MNFNDNKTLWYTILILIIVGSLLRIVVYMNFLNKIRKEGMVTLGTDLKAIVDIPGGKYCDPIHRDNVTPDCNNGIGIEPPAGYTKENVGTELKPIFKMKAIIPSGYMIAPRDSTKLLPKDNDIKYAVESYRLATDKTINMGSIDIKEVNYALTNGFTAPLEEDHYRTMTADTDTANPANAIFTQGEKVMAVYKGGNETSISVGKKVTAFDEGNNKWLPATVVAVNPNNTYKILFDNQTQKDGLTQSQIRSFDYNWFSGTVTTVNPNDTFKITFDNGSVEDGIAKDKIRAIKYRQKPIPDPLPNGYELDSATGLMTFNLTLYALQTFQTTFDANSANDANFKYRDDVPMDLGTYYQYDQNGNMIEIQNTEAEFSPVLYYVPGAYKFGSSNYVPNYEDSVYLSRTTRQSQTTPVYNTASMLGGFCAQYKNDTTAIEEKCAALDLNACASTSCCALLGGQKCVAGNENGPKNVANYTDYSLKNRDFYYYQGKCYGNCQNK